MNMDEIIKAWGDNYDYESAVFNDLKEYAMEWIEDHFEEEITLEDLRASLYDDSFIADSVTGNGSGSYFCSKFKAELALVGNSYEYEKALEEFGSEYDPSPESRDVTIRCWMLGQVIDDVLEDDELVAKFDALKSEKTEEETEG